MGSAVRIVAGSLGGRVLRAPPGAATRPTSERVREALFSILGPPVADSLVLDLFAGSGALGLEALSRGAGRAVFVDKARPAADILRRNLAELGVAARAEVVVGDALAFIAQDARGARGDRGPYRWVFIDPPYRTDLAVRALEALPRAALTSDAVVVVEHDRRNSPAEAHGDLLRTDSRRYGDTCLSLFRPRLPEPTP
jgi:16S rRNA (guanine(966)-N(2))-methyltransferase RsmD